MIEDNELAAPRRLCNAATPGPWVQHGYQVWTCIGTITMAPDDGNAAFIAAARTLLPRALDEIEYQRRPINEQRIELTQLRGDLAAERALVAQLKERIAGFASTAGGHVP